MSFTELSEQEIIRRNSLNELAKLGIEAYPAPEFQVNAHAAEIKERFDETAEPRNVVIAGRMMSRRIHFSNYRMLPAGSRCMSAGTIFLQMKHRPLTIRFSRN